MAKSKKKIGNIAVYVAILLGIAAVVMMFLPSVQLKESSAFLQDSTSYSGLQVAFGYKTAGTISIEVLSFSIMSLLTYILAAVGILFAILSVLGKGSKFALFIAAAAFIVSGVFFFLQPSFMAFNDGGAGVNELYTLAIGSILGAVFSLISGIACLAKVVLK